MHHDPLHTGSAYKDPSEEEIIGSHEICVQTSSKGTPRISVKLMS